ncbi:MAG: hypothetical protein ABIO65_12550 [Nitrospiria bacterium]
MIDAQSSTLTPAAAPETMQYLIVACNITRVVTVNDRAVGRTDEPLALPAGEYVVSLLAPPHDFRPKSRRVSLRETSAEKPLIVRFETR